MTTNKLDQLISDIDYAYKSIHQAQELFKNGALTEKERKANEGIHFGSALFGLLKDIDKAKQSLFLIKVFRDPDKHQEFIQKLNFYAKQGGVENYTDSIIPPEEDTN